ncbi:MAG: hypothetical protein ABSG68_19660 [Thermoguttaceae bacterium]
MLVDATAGAILVISTVVAVESRLRSRRRWYQIEIRDLLIGNVVVALYLTLFLNMAGIQDACGKITAISRIYPLGNPLADDVAFRIHGIHVPLFSWFIRLPVLFALGCLFWLAGDILLKSIACCHRRLIEREGT